MQKIYNFKEELINRYKYLYENISYVLAPYIYRESEKETKKRLRRLCCTEEELTTKPLVLRKRLDNDILSMLEEFLLSDIPFQDSLFYNYIESCKESPDFLNSVKYGVRLSEERIEQMKKRLFNVKSYINIWDLLEEVRAYIISQKCDKENKKSKLDIIDEYFRICRYKNNGSIWGSGYALNCKDFINNYITDSFYCPPNLKLIKRCSNDPGVTKNIFIDYFMSMPKGEYNDSWLSEKQKQDIYLCYHDELPWDLEFVCVEQKDDNDYCRPQNTKPCGEKFYIDESKIFKIYDYKTSTFLEEYYQMCPKCGYIVRVPDYLLSEGIKKRITERCMKDISLSERMFMFSKLKQMEDRLPDNGYVKVLTKKK